MLEAGPRRRARRLHGAFTLIEMLVVMAELVKTAGGRAERLVLPGKTHSTADTQLGAPGDSSGEALLRFVRNPPQ